jgi:hypothetical protein
MSLTQEQEQDFVNFLLGPYQPPKPTIENISAQRREELEMSGYHDGRSGYIRYNSAIWTEAQRNAYNKQYDSGEHSRIALGE